MGLLNNKDDNVLFSTQICQNFLFGRGDSFDVDGSYFQCRIGKTRLVMIGGIVPVVEGLSRITTVWGRRTVLCNG